MANSGRTVTSDSKVTSRQHASARAARSREDQRDQRAGRQGAWQRDATGAGRFRFSR